MNSHVLALSLSNLGVFRAPYPPNVEESQISRAIRLRIGLHKASKELKAMVWISSLNGCGLLRRSAITTFT